MTNGSALSEKKPPLMSDVNPREEIWDLLAKKYSQYWWNQAKLAALFIVRI